MLMDNAVIRFLNKMADLLILNLLFVLCSIPIVTIGPAITAMYTVSLRSVRYGDGYVIKVFMKGFRQNFLQSIIVWVGILVVSLLSYIDILFWMKIGLGAMSYIMIIISSIFIFFLLITALWIFPVIAKLENKLTVNIKNAAAFAVGHFFPYTILCVMIVGVAFYMAYVSISADVVMLLIGFALLSYILSFFFYKALANYLEEECLGEEDLLYYEKKPTNFN